MSLNRLFAVTGTCLLMTAIAVIWAGRPFFDLIQYEKERETIGGDIEIMQAHEPIPFDASAYLLFSSDRISRTVETAAIARSKTMNATIRLKGIDAAYPLYGKLTFSERTDKEIFFNSPKYELYGAAINEQAAKVLNLRLGDIFMVARTRFKVNAIISHEPDAATPRFALLPLVMINNTAFAATGFADSAENGILFRCRARLEPGVDVEQLKARAENLFSDPRWVFRDIRSHRKHKQKMAAAQTSEQ